VCRVVEARMTIAAAVRRMGRTAKARICGADHGRTGWKIPEAPRAAGGRSSAYLEENAAGTLSSQAGLLHHPLAGFIRTEPVSCFFGGTAASPGSECRSILMACPPRDL